MNNTSPVVRTRFAPSPTGYVHIGGLRTALYGFLLARQTGGVNILRVEDTDQARLVEGALENLVRVLHEVGIDYDEGFRINTETNNVEQIGEFGPYLQSERLPIYQEHIQKLLEQGSAYYCFCSPERLDELRAEQTALKKPPMYDRLCRKLDKEEVEEKLQKAKAEGTKFVVRQAVPEEGETSYSDIVFGTITIKNSVLEDQVLIKSDGFPTYNFANVVDDHLMQITHVLRGEEFIPSTPKHILLYQAFGFEIPTFIHLPVIVNEDKKKLSKRQGDVAVEDFLKKGYLKEALLNFIALLGWNPKTEQEIFTLNELVEAFDIHKLNKSNAIFDFKKLDWLNGCYIRAKNSAELIEMLAPFWSKSNNPQLSLKTNREAYLEKIVDIEKERLKKLSDIDERTEFYFSNPQLDPQKISWKKCSNEQTVEILKEVIDFLSNISDDILQNSAEIQRKLEQYMNEKNLDKGSLLWPIRYALSGLEASPSPFELISVLSFGYGKEEVITRLENAVKSL